MHHNLFIYALLEGYSCCFQFGVIVNEVAMNRLSFLVGKFLGMGFLGCMINV